MCFHCYGILKFPLTCNGKNENLIADILTKVFSEMFIVCIMFVKKKKKFFLVVMATKRLNLRKIFKKSTPQKQYLYG